ncbi:acetylcholinesterase-like [Dermacentor silvarum]|uniref:acetylcholinesterase-like n=1 Tax=Dermacentor silvarum TaxID=543639 RepID=UPI001898AC12|nr:acetylcholinesterase-like [Dermacentor silvarum]
MQKERFQISGAKLCRCVLLLLWCTSAHGGDVERVTSLGTVSGRKLNLLNTIVEEYIGIPYAEPPLGELRFRPPLPSRQWTDTFDATTQRTACPQGLLPGLMAGDVVYTEDCLRLNVWTSLSQRCLNKDLSPILVWIHGGGFSYGSASYDNYTGATLAAKTGLVVISMNYRLGALGFLDANSPEAPGNMGLMDQNLALRWIRDNAEFFGGDSSKVTLFGQSAGALSVHGHMLSPMSKGLFTRAVMLSGALYTIDSYNSPSYSLRMGERLAMLTGCADGERNLTTHANEVLKCLRENPVDELVLATHEAGASNAFTFLTTYHNDFLPKEPRKAVDAGFASQVDLIIGTTSDELSSVLIYPPVKEFLQERLDGIKSDKITGFFEGAIGACLKSHMPGDEEHYVAKTRDASNIALTRAYIQYMSDRMLNCPVLYVAQKHAAMGNNVFSYVYDYNYVSSDLPSWIGAPHGAELAFLFGFPLTDIHGVIDEHRAMSEALIKILASFAESGTPELPSAEEWPKYSEDQPISVVLAPGNYSDIWEYRGGECDYWRKYL